MKRCQDDGLPGLIMQQLPLNHIPGIGDCLLAWNAYHPALVESIHAQLCPVSVVR
jgi:hypothetical protein